MESGLDDTTVLVTGASGGIGRALAETFAAEGARLVLVAGRRSTELEAWTAAQPWRERALCLGADVARAADLEAAFARAEARFGRVDVTVANAGVWPRESRLLHEVDEARIRSALDANLFGALWTARAALGQLARLGPRADGVGASICCIGSTAGRFGERGHAEYAVSKAGLYGLVRTLKNEIVRLDPYGRVNLVEPGWTVTHMARAELEQVGAIANVARTMPLRQLARAADIARAVAFLASPRLARHVSGEVLTVAGGMEGRTQWERGEVDEAAVRARLAHD
ncbi:MAG TPA: SDR family oxidoreductase [Planctomycetota bacterium]|nr:SDR family oxidoreductase [Planctomycetota bacterium]